MVIKKPVPWEHFLTFFFLYTNVRKTQSILVKVFISPKQALFILKSIFQFQSRHNIHPLQFLEQ